MEEKGGLLATVAGRELLSIEAIKITATRAATRGTGIEYRSSKVRKFKCGCMVNVKTG